MPTCLVLGMHRSGTSLVARAVNLLGWSLGDDDELIPPADDNPTGFWESSPIVSFNDLILSRLGGSWEAPPALPAGWEASDELPTRQQAGEMLDRVFGDADRRCWKDPRTSLLLPYWQQVTEIDHAVVVLRHPADVERSLRARSAIDSDWSHYLWLRYTAAAVTSALKPTLVVYDEILADPGGWFDALGANLGVTVSPESRAAFLEHSDPSLRHHENPGEPASPLGALAVVVFENLKARSSEPMAMLAAVARGEFDDIEDDRFAAVADLHDQLSRTRTAVSPMVPLQARTRSMARTISRAERRLTKLERERDRLAAKLDASRAAKEEAEVAKAKAIRGAEERELVLREHLAKSNAALAVARRRAAKAERNFRRLKGRRSVRLALRAADLARPAFRLRRRQRSGRVARGREAKRAPTARRLTDVQSPFHDRVRSLVEGGSAELIETWDASEDVLDALAASGTGAQPLVSIVMPTWNRREVIGDAISSVLAQTYENWELLVCDDGSEDNTRAVVRNFKDDRIHYRLLPRGGAARARNAGLAEARGTLIAYLDSDNVWHPRFLETQVAVLEANPGRWCAYSKYLDVVVNRGNTLELKKFSALPFHYDQLSKRNFIDLNTVVHRRVLHDELGGFDESLVRQQDWDLLLKYAFLRDPYYIDSFLLLYRRNEEWGQITSAHKGEPTAPATIAATVAGYYTSGLPALPTDQLPSLSIVSWDICRNHFSKAYNLAEAASRRMNVQLVGFRFFDEPIFPPYAQATPEFETHYLDGGEFPGWAEAFARAVALAGQSDVVYAVKPRLPSLGVALLANHNFSRPIVLESNDLEAVVTAPRAGQEAAPIDLADVDPADPALMNPYGDLWTGIMEGLAFRVPLRATHNSVLDEHFGGGAFWIRNPKDERHYDPSRHDRQAVRKRLGFRDTDRVLLFGGMVRRHKGVFDLLPLLDAHPDYRLLVVGSRSTPDEARLRREAGERATFVNAVDRNEMAAINLASDAVILWLDPTVPASHYQMPYKLTDALAMRVPVVANDIGDLGRLAESGFLRLAPFGDRAALATTLDEIFRDPEATERMTAAGRRLYMREFSYDAVRHNLAMIARMAEQRAEPLDVAGEFAEFFSRFYSNLPDRITVPGAQP